MSNTGIDACFARANASKVAGWKRICVCVWCLLIEVSVLEIEDNCEEGDEEHKRNKEQKNNRR